MQIPRRPSAQRGSALILVLAITLMLAAIAIAVVFSARVEGQSSRAFRERVRAQLAAEEGVEIARSQLASAFSNPLSHVATMPGRIMVQAPGADEWDAIELSSGPAANGADINRIVRSGDGLRLLDPLGADMRLNWVWLRKDGSRVVQATAPSYDATNPLVARYAFWVDDEATKVNLNTARRRMDNGYVPAQIDISSVNEDISEADADLIFSRTKQRPLQSIREVARIADEDVAEAVSRSRLALTHFNRSSNLNPWGDPKIILTTQLDNLPKSIRDLPESEREKYFVDILTNADGSVDPGWNGSVSFPKLTRFLLRLNKSLTSREWPLHPGVSFHDKFKSYSLESDRRITQLGLDIIQYVRSAESSLPIVSLLRGRWVGENFQSGTTQDNLFVAVGRAPLITEVALWVSELPANADGSYNAQLRVEIYSPPYYHMGDIDLTEFRLVFQALDKGILPNESFQNLTLQPEVLSPGGYAVITTPEVPLRQSQGDTPYVLTKSDIENRLWLRIVLQRRNPANGFDLIEQATTGNRDLVTQFSGIDFRTKEPTPSIDATPSTEVDDPRSNKAVPAWVRRNSGNSFGEANSIWKQSPAAADGLPQDKDGDEYSSYSLRFPPPKGQVGNLLGRVTSIGELGRVVSGVETHGSYLAHAAPWRTLRFQPTSSSDAELPDWMLLELFAAPVVPEPDKEPIYFTGRDLVAGRLNVNTALHPFENLNKTETLAALFGDENHPAIENVLNLSRASGARIFGGADFLALPGELAEIREVSDSGEQSEEIFREVITQVTTSSRVFSIFAIGEAIVQSPSGQITISSSRTVEATVVPVEGSSPLLFKPASWQVHPL